MTSFLQGLLGRDDPSPFVVENEGAQGPFLLVCDHAGRAVPQSLNALGLSPAAFERHIAWDIGAGAVSRLLAQRLESWLIRQTYSRLVIDCNRAPDHPGLVLAVSDHTPIPGNEDISVAEVRQRIAAIHAPYHDRIALEVERALAAGRRPALLLAHSFTPRMNGLDRPWLYGILHMGDSPLSDAMLALLRREVGEAVGDNQPYSMDGTDYTAPRHAIANGLDYLEIEVRQDLIADEAGQAQVAEFLAPLLMEALGQITEHQR
jgi:predicted N-formylglutamate amidohydrolase